MKSKITVLDGIELTNLVNVAENFVSNGGEFSDFEQELHKQGNEILQQICSNVLTIINDQIYESPARKTKWEVTRHDKKKILTMFGWSRFTKTMFKNQTTNENAYLLDKFLNFEGHTVVTDNAKAIILKEAAETSYSKAGSAIDNNSPLTKATVKNYVHELDFSEPEYEEKLVKRTVKTLYIEADEDHAHLQFNKKKGDIEISESGRKKNGIITKMIYVHEGCRPVGNQKNRNELINKKYFNSLSNSEDNDDFWARVSNYINATYNIKNITQIIIQGDGGAWIQAGLNHIPKSKFILDEFHLKQSLKKISRCAFDSSAEVYQCLLECIRDNDAIKFINAIKDIAKVQNKESRLNTLKRETYALINHWGPANARLNVDDEICGCSAEGHISHYLSKRMSRDPLGWSKKGATNIARLIEANLNGENIVDLIKYQKKKQKQKYSEEIKEFMKEFERSLKARKPRPVNEKYAQYYDSIQQITSPGKIKANWIEEALAAF